MDTSNLFEQNKNALSQAIRNNLKVIIKYYSLKSEITERLIGNIEFTEEFDQYGYYGEHIKAYCYLRNEERHFKIDRILSIQIIDDNIMDEWIESKKRGNSVSFRHANIHQNNSQSKTACFVATHLYGINAPETLLLRAWRDDYLVKYVHGRFFIKYYYKFSPSFIDLVSRSRMVDIALRKILRIVIRYVLNRI